MPKLSVVEQRQMSRLELNSQHGNRDRMINELMNEMDDSIMHVYTIVKHLCEVYDRMVEVQVCLYGRRCIMMDDHHRPVSMVCLLAPMHVRQALVRVRAHATVSRRLAVPAHCSARPTVSRRPTVLSHTRVTVSHRPAVPTH
jgi:hypothetical protein